MFRDRRPFRCIAFRVPDTMSTDNIIGLLPANDISDPEILSGSDKNLEVQHFFYYSPEKFSSSSELESQKTEWRGAYTYKYNLYLITFKDVYTLTFLAVPFFRMAKHLFTELHESSKGSGLVYQKISLSRLISSIRHERHLGGRLKIAKVKMLLRGDPSASVVVMEGSDVPHSKTFIRVESSLAGIAWDPLLCGIIYDDHHGSKFNINTDKFGNFWFYLQKGARNIFWSKALIDFLSSENLIEQTPWLPIRRLSEDSSEDEYANL